MLTEQPPIGADTTCHNTRLNHNAVYRTQHTAPGRPHSAPLLEHLASLVLAGDPDASTSLLPTYTRRLSCDGDTGLPSSPLAADRCGGVLQPHLQLSLAGPQGTPSGCSLRSNTYTSATARIRTVLSSSHAVLHAQQQPPRDYVSPLRVQHMVLKVQGNVHPEDLPSDVLQQLSHALQSTCGLHLAGAAVRRGCVELMLQVTGPFPEASSTALTQDALAAHHLSAGAGAPADRVALWLGANAAAAGPRHMTPDSEGIAIDSPVLAQMVQALGIDQHAAAAAAASQAARAHGESQKHTAEVVVIAQQPGHAPAAVQWVRSWVPSAVPAPMQPQFPTLDPLHPCMRCTSLQPLCLVALRSPPSKWSQTQLSHVPPLQIACTVPVSVARSLVLGTTPCDVQGCQDGGGSAVEPSFIATAGGSTSSLVVVPGSWQLTSQGAVYAAEDGQPWVQCTCAAVLMQPQRVLSQSGLLLVECYYGPVLQWVMPVLVAPTAAVGNEMQQHFSQGPAHGSLPISAVELCSDLGRWAELVHQLTGPGAPPWQPQDAQPRISAGTAHTAPVNVLETQGQASAALQSSRGQSWLSEPEPQVPPAVTAGLVLRSPPYLQCMLSAAQQAAAYAAGAGMAATTSWLLGTIIQVGRLCSVQQQPTQAPAVGSIQSPEQLAAAAVSTLLHTGDMSVLHHAVNSNSAATVQAVVSQVAQLPCPADVVLPDVQPAGCSTSTAQHARDRTAAWRQLLLQQCWSLPGRNTTITPLHIAASKGLPQDHTTHYGAQPGSSIAAWILHTHPTACSAWYSSGGDQGTCSPAHVAVAAHHPELQLLHMLAAGAADPSPFLLTLPQQQQRPLPQHQQQAKGYTPPSGLQISAQSHLALAADPPEMPLNGPRRTAGIARTRLTLPRPGPPAHDSQATSACIVAGACTQDAGFHAATHAHAQLTGGTGLLDAAKTANSIHSHGAHATHSSKPAPVDTGYQCVSGCHTGGHAGMTAAAGLWQSSTGGTWGMAQDVLSGFLCPHEEGHYRQFLGRQMLGMNTAWSVVMAAAHIAVVAKSWGVDSGSVAQAVLGMLGYLVCLLLMCSWPSAFITHRDALLSAAVLCRTLAKLSVACGICQLEGCSAALQGYVASYVDWICDGLLEGTFASGSLRATILIRLLDSGVTGACYWTLGLYPPEVCCLRAVSVCCFSLLCSAVADARWRGLFRRRQQKAAQTPAEGKSLATAVVQGMDACHTSTLSKS